MRNAILETFGRDLAKGTLFAFLGEAITVTYVNYLYYLFEYIKDPSQSWEKGLLLCIVYAAAIFTSALCRNYYMFLGYVLAIKMRKTLVSNLYDKVSNLSAKSMTETNSGKLITIISGDIFNVERAVSVFAILPTTPSVTLLVLFYIGR